MEDYQAIFKRKEIKYLLTQRQLTALMPTLQRHMEPDAYPHSSILNLYYDTPDFRLIRRSLEKPEYKEKLRLRSYGVPDGGSSVFPEIKKKACGIVYKRRVSMPYRQALAYLAGQAAGEDGQIFREMDWMLLCYSGLRARVFLSYERDSWCGENGLRLTIDRDIAFRTHQLDLRHGAGGQMLLPDDMVLMEIKIPDAAPLWLSRALSENGIFPTSFSKYGKAYETICKEEKQYA